MISKQADDRLKDLAEWARDQASFIPRHFLDELARDNIRQSTTFLRICMMAAMSMNRLLDANDKHIFDDDALWHIVEREMSIGSDVFYRHMEYYKVQGTIHSSWYGLTFLSHPLGIRKRFYRTFINANGEYLPKIVDEFPAFATFVDVPAEFNITEAVIGAVIGGMGGDPTLEATSVALRSLSLLVDGVPLYMTFDPLTTDYHVTIATGDTLALVVEPEFYGAYYEIENVDEAVIGENIVQVTVYSDDGSASQVYSVVVTK